MDFYKNILLSINTDLSAQYILLLKNILKYIFIDKLSYYRFCTDSNDVYIQRRRVSTKLRNSLPATSNTYSTSSSDLVRPSSSDMHNFPSTAVVMTQGRKVKTSLQRLEQQQDEMFQL